MSERLRISLKRNDVCYLLDALESVIEDFKYDGGLILAEDYITLENRLRARLTAHDTKRLAASRSGDTP